MASVNPPDNPQLPRPSGDLEHLFRQQLAEAEVRPRANFWDQLDHELVTQQHDEILRQNAMYRQRAAVYRGAAAASLVLALGLGSWAYMNHSGPAAGPTLATNAPAVSPGLRLPGAATEATSIDELVRRLASHRALAQQAAAYGAALPGQVGGGYEQASLLDTNEAYQLAPYQVPTLAALSGSYQRDMATWGRPESRRASFDELNLREALGLGRPGQPKSLAAAVAPATLALRASMLATTPEPAPKASGKLWKRLHVGGSYALSVFNPNINFSRADARTQTDPVTNALRNYYQDDAEREYRRNLRSGPSQRVALTAAYELGSHWTIATGAEWAESRASSATSFGFLDGKQVGSEAPDFFAQPVVPSSAAGFRAGSTTAAPTRATSYRYRTAAVPVSLTYGSRKPGLSLYAKAGAVMSILLSSRSELEGSPEAGRSYDIRSAESPYRTLFASGRLGGGVRYQPALSTWNVTVGPSAEVFITPLNANPSQRAARQTRPYSLGLEATVEFGSTKVMPGVQ